MQYTFINLNLHSVDEEYLRKEEVVIQKKVYGGAVINNYHFYLATFTRRRTAT